MLPSTSPYERRCPQMRGCMFVPVSPANRQGHLWCSGRNSGFNHLYGIGVCENFVHQKNPIYSKCVPHDPNKVCKILAACFGGLDGQRNYWHQSSCAIYIFRKGQYGRSFFRLRRWRFHTLTSTTPTMYNKEWRKWGNFLDTRFYNLKNRIWNGWCPSCENYFWQFAIQEMIF